MLRRTSPVSSHLATHLAPMGTGMKRNSAIEPRKLSRFARKAGAILAAAATFVAATAMSKPAAAQEIQLTGPLAGAPSVRKMRLYRQGRVELAVGAGLPILFEYERPFFVAGRLQYNVFDWLGIGVFGGFAVINATTDLTDKVESTAPRNTRTALNIPARSYGLNFAQQTGKLKYMVNPQITFSPFRGKLAVFQKLFVDTDLYIHGGVGFIGVEERADCTVCTTKEGFATKTRTAVAPTFGLGLTLYTSGLVSVNMEYRAYPFSWNRGGFDSRGGGPDASFPDNKITDEDRTFKFNQMIFIGAGFYLPASPRISE
jgi:outer membrane beta-barrel protein